MKFWVNRNSAAKYLSFNNYVILLEIAGAVGGLEHFQWNLGYVKSDINSSLNSSSKQPIDVINHF